ncbi:MAG: DUF2058 family protein [Xanthomonadales bacterium]|jgi:uncharacterized protein YaiL (DUF2058 family)|nr:DUF2058 family protein [Xanthomonadales bacterium]
MSGSLRDQLKALGLAKPKPEPVVEPARRSAPLRKERRPSVPVSSTVATAASANAEEISLAKAYAAKVAAEQADAAAARRLQEEKARQKRERKAAAQALLQGKCLVKADAELSRHFEYGKKIRRIYVDAVQLRDLNAGRLGIAQLDGRFLLVTAETIDALHAVAPEFVALRVDPNAPRDEDVVVPDDLHW